MRYLGSLTDKQAAETFVAYLTTRGIASNLESGEQPDRWDIWVRDEDRIADSKEAYLIFVQDPASPQYASALKTAQQLNQEKLRKQQANAKQIKTGRQVFRGGPVDRGGIPPVTLILLLLSGIASLVTEFMEPSPSNRMGSIIDDNCAFVAKRDYDKAKDPAASLKKGQIWRVITPMFPHGGPVHILFNFLAMIQLGRIVERMEGSWRYLALVLITNVFACLLQGLMPERYFGYPFFGGLSGVVYGVFGFLLIKTQLQPQLGIRLSTLSIAVMLVWLVVGFTGQLQGVANLAHLGGFASGVALAYLSCAGKV
jgi:GlpG protein